MRALSIGLLTTSFPRFEGDVAGNFVLGFARALARRGHQLQVLAPEPARGQPPAHEPGIDVQWVHYLPRPLQRTFYGAGVIDNLRRDPRAALGLLPFVLALTRATWSAPAWDVVISHWAMPCALIAGELARRRGIPHLAVLHSADVFVLERMPGAAARRALAERIATGADALLFSSRDLRRRFLAMLGPLHECASRAHGCPMGIDPQTPARAPREQLRAQLGVTDFTLLAMSRLVPIKGLKHAIDALAGTPCSLAIAGDGPERAALERHARAAPVRFLGVLRASAKSDWLHAADAFVLPSVPLASGRTEGMPNSLLEAMEHGLPAIASDVGGVRDVLRDGENGFLVPPGDAAAITRALCACLHPMRRAELAIGARQTAAMYHWDALAPRLEELLARES